MAEGRATGRGSGGTGTKARADEQTSGTNRLKDELEHYIEARLQVLLEGLGDRLGAGARRLGEAHVSPRGLTHAVARGGKKLGEHLPSGGALTSTASHAKETASHAKDTVVGKAKEATGQASGQSDDADTDSGQGKGPGSDPQSMGKGLTIIEDIDVGVPVREAYNQWTQFQEFERFAKGVVSVEQQDDTTTRWHVKVGKSKRQLRGMITEQVPDERIAWTSSGERGTTQGVVTFHPITDNLTKVLLVLRYFPQGPVEKVGSWVRSQGRRARLDLKLYRTFVMMRGEATGGWRGEIREGEVVREPEEVEAAEDDGEESEEGRAGQEEEPEDEYEEDDQDEYDEEDDDREPEDEYDDEEPDDDERAEDERAEDDWEEDQEEDEEENEEEVEDREPDDRNDDTDEQPRPKRRRRV